MTEVLRSPGIKHDCMCECIICCRCVELKLAQTLLNLFWLNNINEPCILGENKSNNRFLKNARMYKSALIWAKTFIRPKVYVFTCQKPGCVSLLGTWTHDLGPRSKLTLYDEHFFTWERLKSNQEFDLKGFVLSKVSQPLPLFRF